MTDEEIAVEQRIIEVSKRDVQKFRAIYDRYFEDIFEFIYRRADDEQLADDLCSQTFVKALENLKRYEFRGLPFSAWLYRIATNEVNKHFNKKNRNRVFSLEEERVKELMETDDEGFTDAQIQQVREILDTLPTATMEILELRFFEGLGFKEIAYILNIGESGPKCDSTGQLRN